jgi:hypothetical protein
MRVLYPDLVFGAIASSGACRRLLRPFRYGIELNGRLALGHSAVTHAVLTNWEYMDVIRLAADPKCSSNLVKSISTVDGLLKVGYLRGPLKKLFGLGELESDQDFVSVLTVCLSAVVPRVAGPVLMRAGRSVSAGLVAGSELGSRRWLDDIR